MSALRAGSRPWSLGRHRVFHHRAAATPAGGLGRGLDQPAGRKAMPVAAPISAVDDLALGTRPLRTVPPRLRGEVRARKTPTLHLLHVLDPVPVRHGLVRRGPAPPRSPWRRRFWTRWRRSSPTPSSSQKRWRRPTASMPRVRRKRSRRLRPSDRRFPGRSGRWSVTSPPSRKGASPLRTARSGSGGSVPGPRPLRPTSEISLRIHLTSPQSGSQGGDCRVGHGPPPTARWRL